MINIGEKHDILSEEVRIGEIEIVGIHPPDEVYFTVEIEDGFNVELNGGPFFDVKIPKGLSKIEKVWVELEAQPALIKFRWKT